MKQWMVRLMFAGAGVASVSLIFVAEPVLGALKIQGSLRSTETRSYLFQDPERAENPLPKLSEGRMLEGFRPPQTRSDYESRVNELGGTNGVMEVTLAWEGLNDVDLAVITPGGRRIDANSRFDGHGRLDLDYNYTPLDDEGTRLSASGQIIGREHALPIEEGVASDGKFSEHPVEHVVWVAEPPKGRYKVLVNHFYNRERSMALPYTVEIIQDGKLVGRHVGTLGSKDAVDSGDAEELAITFDYPYVEPKRELPPNWAYSLGKNGTLDRIDAANGRTSQSVQTHLTNLASTRGGLYGLDGAGKLYRLGEDGESSLVSDTHLSGVSGFCGTENGLLAVCGNKLFYIDSLTAEALPMLELGSLGSGGDLAWDSSGNLWMASSGGLSKIDLASNRFYRLKQGPDFEVVGIAAGSEGNSLIAFGSNGEMAAIDLNAAEYSKPYQPEVVLGASVEAASLVGGPVQGVAVPVKQTWLDRALADSKNGIALASGALWPLLLFGLAFGGLLMAQRFYGRKAPLPFRDALKRLVPVSAAAMIGGILAQMAYVWMPWPLPARLLAWAIVGAACALAFRPRMPNLARKASFPVGLAAGSLAGEAFHLTLANGALPRLLAALSVGAAMGALIYMVRPEVERAAESVAKVLHQLRAPYQRAPRPQINQEVLR